MNDMVYVRMNLQLLEDGKVSNTNDADPFDLEEDIQEGSDSDSDMEMPIIDVAWLDTAEDAKLKDDHKKITNLHKKMKQKNASQIGWTIDVAEDSARTSQRTGRVSRLPLKLRSEVYGPVEEEEEEEEEPEND